MERSLCRQIQCSDRDGGDSLTGCPCRRRSQKDYDADKKEAKRLVPELEHEAGLKAGVVCPTATPTSNSVVDVSMN